MKAGLRDGDAASRLVPGIRVVAALVVVAGADEDPVAGLGRVDGGLDVGVGALDAAPSPDAKDPARGLAPAPSVPAVASAAPGHRPRGQREAREGHSEGERGRSLLHRERQLRCRSRDHRREHFAQHRLGDREWLRFDLRPRTASPSSATSRALESVPPDTPLKLPFADSSRASGRRHVGRVARAFSSALW